jgi:hypothetical protein
MRTLYGKPKIAYYSCSSGGGARRDQIVLTFANKKGSLMVCSAKRLFSASRAPAFRFLPLLGMQAPGVSPPPAPSYRGKQVDIVPGFFPYALSPCLFFSIALLLLLSCDAAVSSKFIDALTELYQT